MRDGKALQMATSHELGQNFAKAFDIYYQSEDGQADLCYTTSWGASTRLVGGLIMAHGDDHGLIVPPRLAPIQAVVIAVRDEPEVNEACERSRASLKAAGVRVDSTAVAAASDGGSPTGRSRVCRFAWRSVRATSPRVSSPWCAATTARRSRSASAPSPPRCRRLLEDDAGRASRQRADARDATRVTWRRSCEAIDVAQTGFASLAWYLVGDPDEAADERPGGHCPLPAAPPTARSPRATRKRPAVHRGQGVLVSDVVSRQNRSKRRVFSPSRPIVAQGTILLQLFPTVRKGRLDSFKRGPRARAFSLSERPQGQRGA